MRVLLDECVPRPLHPFLKSIDYCTVQQMGWRGKKNGELLALMKQEGIGILLTIDQNLRFQQNLQQAGIAVIVIKAKSNKTRHLLSAIPEVLATVAVIQAGSYVEIEARFP
jgi:predicted nuclease of predicted toxin-antitoxin system